MGGQPGESVLYGGLGRPLGQIIPLQKRTKDVTRFGGGAVGGQPGESVLYGGLGRPLGQISRSSSG